MEELQELKNRMENQRPAPWEALPDLSLYMDQVIGYMPRQLIQYGEGERLTSAMVNNYIKDGLMPRAEGKRYARPHLAYLTAICALKQVLPVKDAGLLVAAQEGTAREMYAHFRLLRRGPVPPGPDPGPAKLRRRSGLPPHYGAAAGENAQAGDKGQEE